MSGDRRIDVTFPEGRAGQPWTLELHAASAQWKKRTGHWPPAFVSDVATTLSDDRAKLLVDALLDCGFAVHRHREVDRVEDMAAGVRATGARLVAICARGTTDPGRVIPFVLALPEVDYILVAGDRPDPSTEREGDPATRGYYVDAVRNPDELAWVMRFICRGLGIASA